MKGTINTTAVATPHTSFPGVNRAALVPFGVTNLIDDPSFDDGGASPSTTWVLGAGWAHGEIPAGGSSRPDDFAGHVDYFRHVAGSGSAALWQRVADYGNLPDGDYQLSFSVMASKGGTIAGSVTCGLGVASISIPISTAGVHSFVFTMASDATGGIVYFTPTSTFNGTIAFIRLTPFTSQTDTGLVTDGDFEGDGSDWTMEGCFRYDAGNNRIAIKGYDGLTVTVTNDGPKVTITASANIWDAGHVGAYITIAGSTGQTTIASVTNATVVEVANAQTVVSGATFALSRTSVPISGLIKQAVTTVAGKTYWVEFTIANYTGGVHGVTPSLDDTVNASMGTLGSLIGTGTFLVPIVPQREDAGTYYPSSGGGYSGEAGYLVIESQGGLSEGDIDDITIYGSQAGSSNELADFNGTFSDGSDWTKETGWTIGSGEATCDGTDQARLYQDIGLTAGRYWLVIFDLVDVTSGGVTPMVGGVAGTERTTVGTHMQIIRAGAGDATTRGTIAFRSEDFTDGDIDNVEVYMVEPVSFDERRVVDRVHYSYAGAGALASSARLCIVGPGGIQHQQYITAKAPGGIEFDTPFVGSKGDPLVAILTAPGANVTGRLNALMR